MSADTDPETTEDAPATGGEDQPETALELDVSIDPSGFDEPRRMMWDQMVEEFGSDAVVQAIESNLVRQMGAGGVGEGILTRLYDARDQLREQGFGQTPAVEDGG